MLINFCQFSKHFYQDPAGFIFPFRWFFDSLTALIFSYLAPLKLMLILLN
jgi:hypothetical protein